LTKAEKFSEKFDVFRLKRFMLEPGRDVNACLQVKPRSMHFSFAVLPTPDQVVIYRGRNSTERGSAGSLSFPRSFWES